jgi:G3E family GTPase
MEGFCRENPGVSVRRLALPCMCCPGLADLSGAVRDLMEAATPDWIFVEAPALAAAGLLADFDRGHGLPRLLYVCLDPGWTLALRDDALAPFQLALIDLADLVIPNPSMIGLGLKSPDPGDRTPFHDPA